MSEFEMNTNVELSDAQLDNITGGGDEKPKEKTNREKATDIAIDNIGGKNELTMKESAAVVWTMIFG